MIQEKKPEFMIPLELFRKTRLTVFEALVTHLKEIEGLRYRQIAILLNRDERNIWTVYHRAKKKLSNHVQGPIS